MIDLVLRERGRPIAVAPNAWRDLQLEESVGALARYGILQIARSDAAILLIPSHYVGELRAPNVKLTIQPKGEALYRAILSLALKFEGRIARHYDSAATVGSGDDLAVNYLTALARSTDGGHPWEYKQLTEATSQPRGKPHFAATITAFGSRGIKHRIVAGRHKRHQVRPFVNVVWLAYRMLSNLPDASPLLLSKAAILIEGVDAPDGALGTSLISDAKALLTSDVPLSTHARELLLAALAIVEQEEQAGKFSVAVPSGIARFVNLERLWEKAVAAMIADLAGGSPKRITLHGFAGHNLKLFCGAGPAINPDIVVRNDEDGVELIADAKYKILPGTETGGLASDVYQITCYVDRVGAKDGLLVYLGASDGVRQLGSTQSNAGVTVARLSAESIVKNGEAALTRLFGSVSPLVEQAE